MSPCTHLVYIGGAPFPFPPLHAALTNIATHGYPLQKTGLSALEQQLKDLTLELQAARSEGQAHQALHGAMTALERYQQDLLRAGERAGVLSKRRAAADQELQPEASQPAPGFFVSLVGKVHSVASRLKQNVTLALIQGGFYSPTDEDLRHVPQGRTFICRPAHTLVPAALKAAALRRHPSPALHTCRSFIVMADPQELHRRNAAHRELLPSLLLEARGHPFLERPWPSLQCSRR